MSGEIFDRVHYLQQTLPSNVRLIAVSKQIPTAMMREAYAAGVRDFGESKVQEAEAKQAELCDLPDITWHLIGHLQSNKARKAIAQFAWIHSLDSLKLAQRLNELAESLATPPKVLLQVKLRPDPTKFGWEKTALLADLTALDQCRYLDIQGLMTIPPAGLDSAETLAVFQELSELAKTIRTQQAKSRLNMIHLSMGMSQDYPLAIQAGATMVRLGQTLFGPRLQG